MISIGRVINTHDDYDGDRIQVRVLPADQYKADENVPYAFPLLPKMFRVKPKLDEAVFIITADDDMRSQRYYIGPIISQPQYVENDDFIAGATSLLRGAIKQPSKAPSLVPDSVGTIPKEDEVVLNGRGTSDIVLGTEDVRIRAGVKTFEINSNGEKTLKFNGNDPAFVKLDYFEDGLSTNSATSKSTAVIGADDIILASGQGDPYYSFNDKDETVSEEEIKKMIETAHQLPYGDILVDFLKMFIKMFKSHTHKYHNMPPCPDSESLKFDTKYPTANLDDILLSKHVKTN